MTEETDSILGCFVSSMMGDECGEIFRKYVWGDIGFCEKLKKFKHEDYGADLILILFQFYVNPIPYLLEHLRELENYRKKERSIGVPIIVNRDNFFNRTEQEKYEFLKETILKKFDLLEKVVKRNKLDTNIRRLRDDFNEIKFNSV